MNDASGRTMQPWRLSSETTGPEREELKRLLANAGLTGPHLEIGTAAGGTLKELMMCYPEESRPAFVVVDPFTYFERQKLAVEENLRSVGIDPLSVDFRVGYSWPLLRKAESQGDRYAFIFIDGNHDLKYVTQDLRWTRLLIVGGYVCLHDYSARHPGVIVATDRFLRRNPNYRKVAQVDSLVILRKDSESKAAEISSLDVIHAAAFSTALRLKRSWRKRFVDTTRAPTPRQLHTFVSQR